MDLLLPAASVRLTSRIQDPVQAFMVSFRGSRAGAAHGKEQKKGDLNVSSSRRSTRRTFFRQGSAKPSRAREAARAHSRGERLYKLEERAVRRRIIVSLEVHTRVRCALHRCHTQIVLGISSPFSHLHAVLDRNLPASADASYKHGCKRNRFPCRSPWMMALEHCSSFL